MKKLHLYILGAVMAVLSFLACTDEAEILAPENILSEESSLCTFSIPEVPVHGIDGSSRTAISIENDKLKFVWAEGDRIGILPDVGAQVYFTIDAETAGGTEASFDGGAWALKPNHQYDAYFPFVEDIMLERDAVPVDFTKQTQEGNNSMTHLGGHDYLAAKGTTNAAGGVNYAFQRLASAVILNFVVPDAGTPLKSVTLTADEAVFVSKGKIDLTAETLAIAATETSETMTVGMDYTTETDGETVTLYFMAAPVDLSSKTLNISVAYGEEGKTLEYTCQGKDMTADDLKAAVAELLAVGYTDLTITLAEDAGEKTPEIFVALKNALAESTVVDGSINLTLAGVKEIPYEAFSDYPVSTSGNKLKTLTLTDAETIGEYGVFTDCIYLESFNTPNATAIGEWTFSGCSNLTSVNLPNVTTIGEYAFSGCGFSTVVLPEVTFIGGGAFVDNPNLVSFSAPKATSFGWYPWRIESTSIGTSKLETLKLTAAGTFTMEGNVFYITPTERINLVLNIDKQSKVTKNTDDTATWTYYTNYERGTTETHTFKSISFVGGEAATE